MPKTVFAGAVTVVLVASLTDPHTQLGPVEHPVELVEPGHDVWPVGQALHVVALAVE